MGSKMDKTKLNYAIDAGLAISFTASLITGLVKWPGLSAALGIRHRIVQDSIATPIHDISGMVMAALVLVHLVLHWRWICSVTKRIFMGEKKPNTAKR
ncbi:DUF4405 domain-containing protein [Candidatus Woesearchaeota archaeon]|nr:DUF4405 domain-containing protein [Candidatus Woesearchaeota archaeon]